MPKLGFKILLPLVAFAYCIAFFEIEIGGVQQTWGDEFDTYFTASHSSNIGTSQDVSINPDLTFTPLHSFHTFIAPQLQVVSSAIEINEIIPSPPLPLFIRNCTWLI